MRKFYEVGGYGQSVRESGEITCTCQWSTFEIGRHKKDWENRKDCKHIKELRSLLKGGEDEIKD